MLCFGCSEGISLFVSAGREIRMTVLADFQTIIGDGGQLIHREIQVGPEQQLGVAFEAGGHISGNSEIGQGSAFLMFTVSGVTQHVQVFVNGQGPVGTIRPSGDNLSTQIIMMAGSRLKDTANVISVRQVFGPDFWIFDLVCFYHQDSD